ncbi:hypothetical protein [Desulfurivibrio dismutans]|uniref:hypothetical protein n=1 Tax=Desulfurivibrio dismutans TaxID=1398908 RepID=UPI0023DA746C|nr:hypothetical protein [Desulfurivibrio alkaliphilus]MDF1614448.1 hypothetical protein [Desulfurivibrio alkaliphilus]
MKKQSLILSLLLAGGLMLAAGVGCQRADDDELPTVAPSEQPSPGIYSAPEEEAPPARESEPAAPSYGVPSPEPADSVPAEPAGGYGL